MTRRLLALSAVVLAALAVPTSGAQAATRSATRSAPHAVAPRIAAPAAPQLLWCYDPYWGWYLCLFDSYGV